MTMNSSIKAPLLLLSATAATLLLAGCRQIHDDLIPDDYAVILSLKQSGEMKTELDPADEDKIIDLIILKGGSDPSRAASAELTVMTPAELSDYAAQTGITYTALPAETYEIPDPVIAFEPYAIHQERQVILRTPLIRRILEESPEVKYTIPLLLTSATDSVNADYNILILKLELLASNPD